MIPSWNLSGVLPPFVGSDSTSPGSPYWTTTEELAQRFAHSPARRMIFQGFLKYRQVLLGVGVHDAFQWLDGSFLEDVERVQNRIPQDIDLVTFGHLPGSPLDVAGKIAFRNGHLDLFEPVRTKARYLCDAYFVDLSLPPRKLVDRSKYWSGLFSHRRATYLWKGMVALDLASHDSAPSAFVPQK